jgi:small conductance mechanosensitive channel
VGQEITAAFQGLGGWHDVARWLGREAGDPGRRATWFNASGAVFLVVAAAALASWLLAWALRRPQRAIVVRRPETYLGRLPLVLAELVLDALPIAVFAIAGYLLLTLLDPIAEARIVALAVLNASIGVRIVMALARAVLQPLAPGLRLAPMGDENAAYTDVWVRRLAVVTIYGYLGCQALLLLGMSPVGYDLLLRIVGFVVFVLLSVLVLQNRSTMAGFIRRDADKPGRVPAMQSLLHRAADVWHIVALLLLAGAYCIWAFDVQGGLDFMVQGAISTIVILLVARGLSMLVRRGAERLLGIGADLARRMPLLEVRANRYLSVVFWALQVVLWGVALLAILQAWQIDSFAWFSWWAR